MNENFSVIFPAMFANAFGLGQKLFFTQGKTQNVYFIVNEYFSPFFKVLPLPLFGALTHQKVL